jgi:hypothetical protein
MQCCLITRDGGVVGDNRRLLYSDSEVGWHGDLAPNARDRQQIVPDAPLTVCPPSSRTLSTPLRHAASPFMDRTPRPSFRHLHPAGQVGGRCRSRSWVNTITLSLVHNPPPRFHPSAPSPSRPHRATGVAPKWQLQAAVAALLADRECVPDESFGLWESRVGARLSGEKTGRHLPGLPTLASL